MSLLVLRLKNLHSNIKGVSEVPGLLRAGRHASAEGSGRGQAGSCRLSSRWFLQVSSEHRCDGFLP